METIFAQSSSFGKAGVAVFRVSGTKSLEVLKLLTGKSNFKPRFMYYQKLTSPESNDLIDNAMVVYFKAPNSFTGEDVVEIHTHGSKAISIMLTNALLNIPGVRLAEAGEFTKRAFLNNKFDLTAAEGIADLINAETIMQHKQAIRQAGGALEELYNSWRSQLLRIISLLEAYIDFPDEDIPESVLKDVTNTHKTLINTISEYLNDNRKGELLRSGLKLAIIGPPNAGKSSLLNFLMRRDIAIVSNIAGTTRDIIEGHLDIGGYPIILQDTAGIRGESNDVIEQEGIKRAIDSAKKADIKIVMFDAETLDSAVNEDITGLIDENTIVIINKIDLIPENRIFNIENKYRCLKVSIKNNIALPSILKNIEEIAENMAGFTETPYITNERHRHHLKQALVYLKDFNLDNDLVLATEDIRMTMRRIGAITGIIDVEEILGEIFKNFCIGK
ncbi:tRNA uridine(34) 5-carboxymethylaminomethyl synthesis GTPase MnmE [Rickettsia bellii]|uniref:tRNA modification GTPase MnmE n=3 Tax=Rickettsia bellii TaxID=33990 RepID=MNME_RICBR|nr:tRNA uridine-5-carboxymethylaminomethyl(34) synthesis GTPase MnmE [Rickettsia bellii]Q1RKJ6.1 RecName: Full=tRNA modification GTPase MnmE [Rickettsia bellii RML369-C]ABE04118.1 tRNA modification GTPase TrmE [Rickettsia bellii RML369-C]ARD86051.1 tRNA uridine(34) 5-carboxymethylaminomethyl synthesis GTPase MnmE [Rickettsia bellii]KJV90472.1 tRNA modification GTPase TrmE [Rickettsia bellii str. RML An4]KJV92667.1 tRNA modification GTPase TrmE [Rickettsia bellii str. RML Mogi]